jgi:hypothetical protein
VSQVVAPACQWFGRGVVRIAFKDCVVQLPLRLPRGFPTPHRLGQVNGIGNSPAGEIIGVAIQPNLSVAKMKCSGLRANRILSRPGLEGEHNNGKERLVRDLAHAIEQRSFFFCRDPRPILPQSQYH